MKKRIKKSTKRKAEIAAAIALINRCVASKIELPVLTHATHVSDELVDTKTAARVLGVSAKTLANWRCSGVPCLEFVRTGSRIRYRSSELEKFLINRTQTSTSEYEFCPAER